MRTHTISVFMLALTLVACGKSESPPAQPASSQAPSPAATPVATAEPAAAPADAVSTPTWVEPATATTATDTTATGTTAAPPAPAPQLPAAPPTPETAPTPATEQVAPAPAPVESAPAPATLPPATPAPAEAAPASAAPPGDAPYQVVDGHIDQDTVEGWKIYRGIGTCATCHGPVGQGGVGPALVESLKEKITKELFIEVVANGRDGTMMKPFGENPIVMENIDRIYAYLKARSDGVLGPENLIKYPLGKIE